ncbi:hypothetical protein PFMALIP_05001 [Plasmodium falciparum MaliPS096_E11]|uniref:Uncharacterized protein n=1 Tax=Plasmodium falciparum MaliPS096_E11 TaxID=1036727 RepID=A0A024WJ59_PLAFA|nr:hypothetical protein PFMALIP_05001 [Plasmodium falciparum MaliPS096_E11]
MQNVVYIIRERKYAKKMCTGVENKRLLNMKDTYMHFLLLFLYDNRKMVKKTIYINIKNICYIIYFCVNQLLESIIYMQYSTEYAPKKKNSDKQKKKKIYNIKIVEKRKNKIKEKINNNKNNNKYGFLIFYNMYLYIENR